MNDSRDRNESCRNDHHQSSEKILGEPAIEPVTSCSQVRNATDRAMELSILRKTLFEKEKTVL